MTSTNGHIQLLSISGGGFDEDGNPIKSTEVPTELIQCRIQVNTDSKKGKYEDGRFTQCSYVIFVQRKELNPDRLIVHINGTQREFTVQSIQYLNMTGHTRITV